jgi:hypothetical protein
MTEQFMNIEYGRIWNKLARCNLYYPGICLQGLRIAMIKINHDSCSPGQDLNSESPKYEAGVLTAGMQCPVSNDQRKLYMPIPFPKKIIGYQTHWLYSMEKMRGNRLLRIFYQCRQKELWKHENSH